MLVYQRVSWCIQNGVFPRFSNFDPTILAQRRLAQAAPTKVHREIHGRAVAGQRWIGDEAGCSMMMHDGTRKRSLFPDYIDVMKFSLSMNDAYNAYIDILTSMPFLSTLDLLAGAAAVSRDRELRPSQRPGWTSRRTWSVPESSASQVV